MSKYVPPSMRTGNVGGVVAPRTVPVETAPVVEAGGYANAIRTARPTPVSTTNTVLKVVEVDSLVLLKVLKHCRDFYPTPVNGQLLGAEGKEKLEVTNCFPLPQKKEILQQLSHEKGAGDLDILMDEEFDKYQDKMAELMHDVNVDCFTVGWYQTLCFGDLKSKDNIDSLVLYQDLVDKAVMIGFDPLLHSMGKTAFKAYRVNPDFLTKYHEYEQDVSRYNKLRAKDILVEVPIVIVNPFLVEAFLMDWSVSDPLQASVEYDALDLDQSSYVEKNLNFLSACLESIGEEQDKLQKYQRDSLKQGQLQKQLIERRRLENDQRRLRGEPLLPGDLDGPAFRKVDAPSQLSTLLLASQGAAQSSEVSVVCSETLAKMFLLHWGNMRKRQPVSLDPPAE